MSEKPIKFTYEDLSTVLREVGLLTPEKAQAIYTAALRPTFYRPSPYARDALACVSLLLNSSDAEFEDAFSGSWFDIQVRLAAWEFAERLEAKHIARSS